MSQVPPNSIAAEESVLGAMLLSRDAVGDATELLEPDDFYKPAHGHIYDTMLGLAAAGEPVDVVTVSEALTAGNLLEMVGGPAVLLELQQHTPAVSNAAKYAKIVADKARLRRLAEEARKILQAVDSNPQDVDRVIADAETSLYMLNDRGNTSTERTLKELLAINLDKMEAAAEAGNEILGFETGLADLDRKISGLQPKLYVIAGRPGMGKSALAVQMATNVAKQGHPVLCFSLEMPGDELSQRVLNNEALVDSERAKTGQLGEAEWNRISHAVGRLSEAPVVVDDNPSVTLMDIRAKAQRMKSKHGSLGLVVIDYIQLMEGAGESRQVEVAKISRGAKVLQRDLGCAVVVLAQCNRACESRVDKRPMLSDLRETGSIEQDCDVAIFTYRDEVYDEFSPDCGIAELIVNKQRDGSTGTVKTAFRGQYTRFDSMARPTSSVAVPNAGEDGSPQYDNYVDTDR